MLRFCPVSIEIFPKGFGDYPYVFLEIDVILNVILPKHWFRYETLPQWTFFLVSLL